MVIEGVNYEWMQPIINYLLFDFTLSSCYYCVRACMKTWWVVLLISPSAAGGSCGEFFVGEVFVGLKKIYKRTLVLLSSGGCLNNTQRQHSHDSKLNSCVTFFFNFNWFWTDFIWIISHMLFEKLWMITRKTPFNALFLLFFCWGTDLKQWI